MAKCCFEGEILEVGTDGQYYIKVRVTADNPCDLAVGKELEWNLNKSNHKDLYDLAVQAKLNNNPVRVCINGRNLVSLSLI